MKIVLLNTSERSGGAAVAANRLMHALKGEGHDVKLIVRDKQTDSPDVVSVNASFLNRLINKIRFIWERLCIYVATGFNREILFQVSIANTGTDVSLHPWIQQADVIHIHWINQGFLSLNDISKLIKLKKPIIWTMHDLWITNGIYHYPDKEVSSWLNNLVFRQKRRMALSEITYVGCSKWITSLAERSVLLENAKHISIPNPINRDLYTPIPKFDARSQLGINSDRFIILFGAAKLTDTRKGLIFFLEACKILLDRNPSIKDYLQIELLGKASQEICDLFSFQAHAIGFLSNEKQIAAAYAAADLFVIPSLEDNLPNTIMESMACGTPCVGFRTGGIPEMIDHQVNGYLAEYKSAEDLANGIEWVLNHPNRKELSDACVKKVESCYSESVVARQYIELYNNLLKK